MDARSSKEIEPMVTRWEAGEALPSIAADYGIRPRHVETAVRRYLRKHGDAQLSERKRREAQGYPHAERDKTLATRLDGGEDASEVAASAGVSISTLYRWTSPYREVLHSRPPVPSSVLHGHAEVGGDVRPFEPRDTTGDLNGNEGDQGDQGDGGDEGHSAFDRPFDDSHGEVEHDIFAPAATLRWLHGQSYGEIADELNVPVSVVGTAVREYLALHPHVVRKFMTETASRSIGATA